ncbi:cupin domain-containing protein [Streptomyces sp. LHD-70]|uniref:cupin domain-containing protein n=1 Tax=Streptomyces sp. LHD-70 TaxID=3072140 RepID=UPI00280C4A46|nr:cupin domain-containing protein [Streptomyces sp. LHD-70]MDQ8708106.1 cupin domain-containing protein [Streptomyces sp. LHD-70]
MPEIFQAASHDDSPQTFPVVKSTELEWEDGGAPGFWLKMLHKDQETGARTLLMKVDPGAFADTHAHDQTEQVYVLEGSFYDQTQTYRVGDHVVRQPGAGHATGSTEGAVTLLVYGP